MTTADPISSLALLFDRPNEPIFNLRGENKALFKLTQDFLPPNYVNNGLEFNDRFGEEAKEKIQLKPLQRKPPFSKSKQLPNDADFSLFLPKHQEMATEVIDELMKVPENQLQDFLSTCVYARANLNPQLFNYCFSVALMHRRDTRTVPVQNFAETFPSKFLNSQAFTDARETAAVIPEDATRTPIIIPRDFSATDLDQEHRMAYFREDLGLNLHHWHWHLVYPFTSTIRSIVAKDRRGELFFYMHQQLIARYNTERLCNSLKRVLKFNNWREQIPEAYYPKLDSLTSSRAWPPRQAGMQWRSINRPADGLTISLEDMDMYRNRIEEVLATGQVKLPNGGTQPLDIDILGNIFEASILSPNPDYYGSVHNYGHVFGGFMHDPDHRYLENFNVMADNAINLRDPFFYRWHAYVDDIFQRHKESSFVRPYSQSELENPGVQVTSAGIVTDNIGQNVLHTFWMNSDVNLSRGLDFSDRGAVYARFTHLNYRPFRYVINVNNTSSARNATVRIFLALKNDERNLAWSLSDQRKMFMEMDKFVTPLNAGQNTITRLSTESSTTIPFEQTFRDLSAQGSDPKNPAVEGFNFCGCGWPQHMLLPKGTEGGMPFQLFVMLSNYELDRIDQTANVQASTCKEAFNYCGLKDRLYPDKRSMGYPFDRPSRSVNSIEEFILPNMALVDVTIIHENVTERNPRNIAI